MDPSTNKLSEDSDLVGVQAIEIPERGRSRVWYLTRSLWRDVRNLPRYGPRAPRWGQTIWVDPLECTRYTESYGRSFMGQVRDGDWDLDSLALEDHPKFIACRRHWIDGTAWEETGIVEHFRQAIAERGSQDGCRTVDDVLARYRGLDSLYEQMKIEGALRQRRDVTPDSFRELDGVLIHVTRHGDPLFGGGGFHRLAIAQILELPKIPAVLGLVHRRALSTWKSRYLNP